MDWDIVPSVASQFAFEARSFDSIVGCGTLVVLDLTEGATGLSSIEVTDAVDPGQEPIWDMQFEYYASDCMLDPICELDCEGTPNGSVVIDCADVCGGTSVLSGCDNVCNSTAVEDCAGDCGGSAVDDCTGLCGGTASGCSVTDIDGNGYTTVTIGTQKWLVQNLKTTKYKDGSEIPTGYSNYDWGWNLYTGAYAVYDNNSSNADVYGNLYNWYAVDDSRGICPENYHIPTDDEWYILLEYLGGAPSGSAENWLIAGGKMKDVGTIEDGDGLWHTPNEGATNESGFTAIPAGFRLYDGQYYESGYYSIYWSSTAEYYSDAFFMWYLLHDDSRLYRGLFDSQTGLSVRCLKD